MIRRSTIVFTVVALLLTIHFREALFCQAQCSEQRTVPVATRLHDAAIAKGHDHASMSGSRFRITQTSVAQYRYCVADGACFPFAEASSRLAFLRNADPVVQANCFSYWTEQIDFAVHQSFANSAQPPGVFSHASTILRI